MNPADEEAFEAWWQSDRSERAIGGAIHDSHHAAFLAGLRASTTPALGEEAVKQAARAFCTHYWGETSVWHEGGSGSDKLAIEAMRAALATLSTPASPERATAREVTEPAGRLEQPVSDAGQSATTPQGAGAAVAPTPSPREGDVEEIARMVAYGCGVENTTDDGLEGFWAECDENERQNWRSAARAIIAHLNATTEPSDAG